MKNAQLKVYLAMLLATIFWGFSFIWTKEVLEFYKPLTIVIFRLIISSIFLWIASTVFKKLQKIDRKDYGAMILLAFFQPFLYFVGETIGLSYVSSTVAAVIIATIPLLSPFAAYYFFKEKLSLMNFMGILVSVAGVFMVILSNNFSISAPLIGILLLMMAVIAAVAYSVVVVKLAGKYNVYTVITYQNMIGVFFFLPFFLYFEWTHFINVPYSEAAWISMAELAIFASSVAFMLFTYGIQKLGVTKANTLANIIPVFTAIFAYFILDEVLSFFNIIGIAIVLIGLFLSQINRKFYLRFKVLMNSKIHKSTK